MIAIRKACVITGYKPYELGIFSVNHPSIDIIKYSLKTKIIQIMDEGIEWFIISGQMGVELWAAEIILELQLEGYEAKLAVLIPFLEQEDRYPDPVKEIYQKILDEADFCDAISKRKYENPGQLQQKNTFLVANSSQCLLVYDEEAPGSPQYFLSTARQKQTKSAYTINMITRFDLEDAEQDFRMQDPNFWVE